MSTAVPLLRFDNPSNAAILQTGARPIAAATDCPAILHARS